MNVSADSYISTQPSGSFKSVPASAKPRAQSNFSYKETYQALCLCQIAISDARGDDDVILVRVAADTRRDPTPPMRVNKKRLLLDRGLAI